MTLQLNKQKHLLKVEKMAYSSFKTLGVFLNWPAVTRVGRCGRNPVLLMAKIKVTSDMHGGHVGLRCHDRRAVYPRRPGLG